MTPTALQHDITSEHWSKFTLEFQLAGVGHEVSRAIQARREHDQPRAGAAFDKALALLDLTLQDPKNGFPRRKELLIVREALIDDFLGGNKYCSTDESWKSYFGFFNHIAESQSER